MMVELVSTNLLAIYIWRQIGEEMHGWARFNGFDMNCQNQVSNSEEILHE